MLTITATQVKTEVTYDVTFATENQVVDFVTRKSSTHVFAVMDDFDETLFPLAADALFPSCEHGLSAQLCGGPMHWYDR